MVRSLYISYDGVLEPVGQSQIISYLVNMSKVDVRFNLLTFEKRQYLENIERMSGIKDSLENNLITWHYLTYHKNPTLLATSFDIICGVFKGLMIIIQKKSLVIHGRSFVGAFIGFILSRLSGCKFIYDMRGLYAEERANGDIWPKSGILFKIVQRLENLLIAHADYVVVLTHKVKHLLKKLNDNSRIEVIPTCVDLKKFTIKGKDSYLNEKLKIKNKFVFLYLGSTGTWYMLDEMIDFFKVANQINPDSFFLLLTSDKDLVKKKMYKKGINRMNFFVDFVAYEKIPDWIPVADATLSFIRPTHSKKSSCPTKFAESLACGLPVITNSGIGDTEEIIKSERVGVVVESFNENSYRKAINELLSLLEERPELRERCRTTAIKYFSLEDGVNRYLKIYREIFDKAKDK